MVSPYSDGGGGGQSVRQIISRGGKEGEKRDRVAALLDTYTRFRVGATNGNPSEYPFAKSTSVTSSPASTSKVPLANMAGHKMHTGSTRGRGTHGRVTLFHGSVLLYTAERWPATLFAQGEVGRTYWLTDRPQLVRQNLWPLPSQR